MGKKSDRLTDKQIQFLANQHLFFVATGASDGKINVSPKGMDTLRVNSPQRITWLNLTGSGNETAAHILEQDRMTLMWCSFGDKPLILRTYGHALCLYPGHKDWNKLVAQFPGYKGVRQIFDLRIDLVQASCGFGVPRYDYIGQRDNLTRWADQKGQQGIKAYWQEKNQISLDGKSTGIKAK